MIRKLGFVTVLITALIVSACGRQVTPNREALGATGLQPGFMSVKFRVASGFNFQSDSYAIVFNTTGANVTPVAEAANDNYAGYSIAIVVGGQNGQVGANAFYYYRPTNTSQQPEYFPIGTTPQQLILTLNTNGLGTEFTVQFSRDLANFTVTPTPMPTATPTPSPGTTAAPANVDWHFNFFVVNGAVAPSENAAGLTIIDSLGSQGPTDATYVSPALPVGTTFDTPFQIDEGNHPSIPDALTGGEIANNP
jgi:hypothetical protein